MSWFVEAQQLEAVATARAPKLLRQVSYPVDNPNRRQSTAKTAAVLRADWPDELEDDRLSEHARQPAQREEQAEQAEQAALRVPELVQAR